MKDKEEEEKILCVAWKCIDCKKVLGYTDSRSEILRIKYKDLFVYIRKGEVTVLCRNCGKQNIVNYSEE